jgi:hypothetical protein
VKRYLLSQKGEKAMFERNEGILDRIVRVTLALILLPTGIFLLGGLQGSVLGLVIVGIGALALITGLTGFCPLYVPFGISTLEKEQELTAKLMTRCMSMMAGFRQASDGSGQPNTEQICGPCPPSIVKPHDQHR